MSRQHLAFKRAAAVVPFSTAKTPLSGPLFYDHTHDRAGHGKDVLFGREAGPGVSPCQYKPASLLLS